MKAYTLDPLLQGVEDNLTSFIENIKCIQETFFYSEQTLEKQVRDVNKQYDDYVTQHQKIEVGGKITLNVTREYNKLVRRKERANRAQELIPSNYVVSLVAMFDTFIAGLVRCLYGIKPELLMQSERQFKYLELKQLDSISDVQRLVIEEKVDAILRDSHIKQIEWLAKSFGLGTLNTKDFAEWGDFVELTERRNLFVHSNGVVSKQYIDICSQNEALAPNINEGDRLNVDKEYFEKSYRVLYTIAIVLSQTMLNKVYLHTHPQAETDIDSCIIKQIFELICDKKYDIAIRISNFVLEPHFHHNAYDKIFIVLNLAQSYKWSGKGEECISIINKEDWSAVSKDLCVPKLVLEDKYEDVYSLMRSIGINSEILCPDNYREWPIFQKIREEQRFADVFREIFGEDLLQPIQILENRHNGIMGGEFQKVSLE